MGDAMPSTSEDRTPAVEGARESTADAGDGEELHGKNDEKVPGMTEDEQGSSREDTEEQKSGDGAGEEEEEPGECGFCLFMKSGPCRENFVNWEQCIEQAEKDKEDMVEKCHKVTFMLKECMEHNSDYYEPVLQAEKAMGEAALEEEEAAAMQEVADANSLDSQVPLQSENQSSLDAATASQVPGHAGTEEHHAHNDEQHTHASPEEAHTSKPDSDVAAQD